MATLRDIRRRIQGIKSTQQITKAMKMVAAAKMRRAQERMLAARPYAFKIKELVQHMLANVEALDNPLLREGEGNRLWLVVVTADRGLCGAFNSNVIRRALQEINRNQGKEVSLVCIGKKGYDFFRKSGYPVVQKFTEIFNNLDFSHASEITNFLVREFVDEKTAAIRVIFNEFKNVAQQNLVVENYLPLVVEKAEEITSVDYLYEPTQVELLKELFPKYLKTQTWRVLLESFAAEQAARMVAMENASDNATELIQALTLQYNKARQAAITKELLEIVGGAEALQSG